jgi:protein-disulfide isomerase/mono/diheme cytochrome c family protein
MIRYLIPAVVTCLLSLTATAQADNGRWYSSDQLEKGKQLFQQQCASCHGANAELTIDWKKTDSNGKYPPPPLNGTAHAWHHSLQQLKETIQRGGVPLGGLMPAFASTLSDADIDAAISYFQSKWPEQTYRKWAARFNIEDQNAAVVDQAAETVEIVDQSEITRLLKLRLGTNNISRLVETPVKGVYETQFGDKFAYLIENGRYVFIGEMFDLERAQNLTEISRRVVIKDALAKVAESDMAIFPASETEKAQLTVFTDTSCPYCKKLHEEVSYLQQAGITVRYLPYPRGGERGPGYLTLKQVWCAEDKRAAMDIGKGVTEGELPSGDCEAASFVDRGYEMGNQLGVTGTPALYMESGQAITGYVPYAELIPKVLKDR